MSLWKWLFRRAENDPPAAKEEEDADSDGTIPLPAEPYVFECRDCGKVFEKRRRRPACPECDSKDVELISE
jgi:Zn finger protein HypA/HybF involved in hydrogenase expression